VSPEKDVSLCTPITEEIPLCQLHISENGSKGGHEEQVGGGGRGAQDLDITAYCRTCITVPGLVAAAHVHTHAEKRKIGQIAETTLKWHLYLLQCVAHPIPGESDRNTRAWIGGWWV
jgi:hypothetical protein